MSEAAIEWRTTAGAPYPIPIASQRAIAPDRTNRTAAGSVAAASPASVANDTLTVNGSSRDDRIALRLAAGDPGTLEVDFGDDGSAEHRFDRSTFSNIEVFLRSGNDEFRVDQVNGVFADEALTVDGG